MYPKIGLLVSDFDETITEHDTLCEIANLAYEKRAREEECPENARHAQCHHDKPPPWSYFCETYFRERRLYIEQWREAHSDGTLKGHYNLLNALREVELMSLARVERHRCLAGLCPHELRERGRQITKRAGVIDVLRRFIVSSPGWPRCFYVLSANWSQDMLLGCLEDVGNFSRDVILSNDIVFRNGYSTGGFTPKVLSGIDKLRIFTSLAKPPGTASMYVGDSDTDLPCLCKVIVMCFGVYVRHFHKRVSQIDSFSRQCMRTLASSWEIIPH
jgi:hypothetical protein